MDHPLIGVDIFLPFPVVSGILYHTDVEGSLAINNRSSSFRKKFRIQWLFVRLLMQFWVFRPVVVDSAVVDSAVVEGLLGAPLVSTIKYYTPFNFTSIG